MVEFEFRLRNSKDNPTFVSNFGDKAFGKTQMGLSLRLFLKGSRRTL